MAEKKSKKKAKKKTDLKVQIKEMEEKKREQAAPAKMDKKVSFDSWFHQRKHKIAACHRKEIIAADFKARGLGKEHTMEEFDKALKLYGIEL